LNIFSKSFLILVLLQSFWSLDVALATIEATQQLKLSRYVRTFYRNSGFNWISPKQFKEMDLSSNTKPIMMFLTFSSCYSCRLLMNEFEAYDGSQLSSLSAQFLSVLAIDDYARVIEDLIELDTCLSFPCVVFASPQGEVRYEIKQSTRQASYYYDNVEALVRVMRLVLKDYEIENNINDIPADLINDM